MTLPTVPVDAAAIVCGRCRLEVRFCVLCAKAAGTCEHEIGTWTYCPRCGERVGESETLERPPCGHCHGFGVVLRAGRQVSCERCSGTGHAEDETKG